ARIVAIVLRRLFGHLGSVRVACMRRVSAARAHHSQEKIDTNIIHGLLFTLTSKFILRGIRPSWDVTSVRPLCFGKKGHLVMVRRINRLTFALSTAMVSAGLASGLPTFRLAAAENGDYPELAIVAIDYEFDMPASAESGYIRLT